MNKDDKRKKTAQELIDFLETEKSILFQDISQSEAIEYFKIKNNYMRTASYRQNFEVYQSGENTGKYIDLDFNHLATLSTIDMTLRSIFLKMCIDIEHAMKVQIVTHIEDNVTEDGYGIVESFLSGNRFVIKSLESKIDDIFTHSLIEKYFKICTVFEINETRVKMSSRIISSDCPAWVLVELLTFGELIQFINHYSKNSDYCLPVSIKILNSVRSLRNACAHNNCIFNNLRPNTSIPNPEISQYISTIPSIQKEERKKKLRSRPLYEITSLLYTYDNIVPNNMKIRRYTELKQFFTNEFVEASSIFLKHQLVQTSFSYLQKLIVNLDENLEKTVDIEDKI